MWLWKGFAVTLIAVGIFGIFDGIVNGVEDTAEAISMALFPLSAVALFGYAFNKTILPGNHWFWFAVVYTGWTVFTLLLLGADTMPLLEAAPGAAELTGVLIGLSIVFSIIFFPWLAAWRYGNRLGHASASGTQDRHGQASEAKADWFWKSFAILVGMVAVHRFLTVVFDGAPDGFAVFDMVLSSIVAIGVFCHAFETDILPKRHNLWLLISALFISWSFQAMRHVASNAIEAVTTLEDPYSAAAVVISALIWATFLFLQFVAVFTYYYRLKARAAAAMRPALHRLRP